MLKTKIVCTIGPASSSSNILLQLMQKGMDVARINFSHGTIEEKIQEIKLIRVLSRKIDKNITILQDLCGPKIRVGEVENGEALLIQGEKISLNSTPIISNSKFLFINYPYLMADTKKKDKILLDDGHIELKVIKIQSNEIVCEIIKGGKLKSKKGVNFISKSLRVPALTQKDINDVKFGISQKVDYIALSFVRNPEDIIQLKKLLKKYNIDIPIIAKIEKHEAIKNIDKIVDVSDGIMVARGDLGVEVPIENIAIYQKMIIKKANEKGIPVITATQMLESMIENPMPTRAEVTDISNAILDGTDAIMLSAETSVGKYPVETVEIMARIAEKTEQIINYTENSSSHRTKTNQSIADAVAHATCQLSYDLSAKAILPFTCSGYTARMISKYRPKAPIFVFTTNKNVSRRVNLYCGVICFVIDEVKSTDEMFKQALQKALSTKVIKKGDLIILTAGIPVKKKANTNLIRVLNVE